jgi:hypothetical protein
MTTGQLQERTWMTLPKNVANTALPTRGEPKVYTRTCTHARRTINGPSILTATLLESGSTAPQLCNAAARDTHVGYWLQPEAQVQRAECCHCGAHGVADDVPRFAGVLQQEGPQLSQDRRDRHVHSIDKDRINIT